MNDYAYLVISVILTALAGVITKKIMDKKRPLQVSFLPTALFQLPPPLEHPDIKILFSTHTLLIFNPTSQMLNNIKVSHTLDRYTYGELGKYGADSIKNLISVAPFSKDYQITKISTTEPWIFVEEINFLKLLPKEAITITYAYPTTIAFTQFNTVVKSDEGFAKLFPIDIKHQYPVILTIILGVLIFFGACAVINFTLKFIHIFNILTHSIN